LLDAAHIVSDKDERLGQPVVPNGIPLSKIHHAAFDANLIGIDPDYRLHVSARLLGQNDGPMLEALKRHCHIEQVESVFDRGEARLRHWNRVAELSPG
jgi:predicted restriction endonuclease